MCCGLVAVDAMCTTEALGILKLSSPSSGIVVTCNEAQTNDFSQNKIESSTCAIICSGFISGFFIWIFYNNRFTVPRIISSFPSPNEKVHFVIFLSRNFLFADSTFPRPLSSSLPTIETLAASFEGAESGSSIIRIILPTWMRVI